MLLSVLVSDEVLSSRLVVFLDPPDVPPAHGRPVDLHLVSHGLLAFGRPLVRGVWCGACPWVGQELKPLPRQVDFRLVSVLVLYKMFLCFIYVTMNLAFEPLPWLPPEDSDLPSHHLASEDGGGLQVRGLPLANRVAWGRGGLHHLHVPSAAADVRRRLLKKLVHDVLVPVSRLHAVQVNHLIPLLSLSLVFCPVSLFFSRPSTKTTPPTWRSKNLNT
mmetsp:Transcript_14791/g.28629  ORF Transcript_14791/g.28629 Transcript_14791/m.28629 type:complete len:218 (+) Transcript_14791:1999-2652(+)